MLHGEDEYVGKERKLCGTCVAVGNISTNATIYTIKVSQRDILNQCGSMP